MSDQPEPVIIELTWWEIYEAARVGMARAFDALRNHRRDNYGLNAGPLGGLEYHVGGAIGECAVAKYLNLYWPGFVGTPGKIDVGGKVEVRAVRDLERRLPLHPDDKLLPFVLAAYPALPRVHLRGWTNAADGRRQEFWETFTGRPAYFVPVRALRPMAELRAVLDLQEVA